MVMCWAPDCKHYNVRETCRFFKFPRDIKERNKWIRLLRRNDKPGPGAVVCSCHFRDGDKNNGPELFEHNKFKRTQFLVTSPEKLKRKRRDVRREQMAATHLSEISTQSILLSPSSAESRDIGPSSSLQRIPLMNLTNTETADISDISTIQEASMCEVVTTDLATPSTSMARDPEELPDPGYSFTPVKRTIDAVLQAENYFLKEELKKAQETITYMSEKFCYQNIQSNDKLIVLYTGIPNSTIFEALYELIKDVEIKYYLNWNVTKLSKIDQLLLTLTKLRLNSPQLDLAQRFGVSRTATTNVILTFVHLLHECLFQQLMKNIPTRQKNMTCLPSCFSNFTNCRIVLDCTEIFTVVARKSMKTQRLTYSTYKHHNTCKGLIGVAPNGVITYVSDLYAGSTSDQKIVLDCGILQHLEAGDLILADKGFLIQEILPQGVSINIPPFLRTPQFTKEQVRRTESIAKARIHVERAIRRMKCYHILNFMAESLCPYGDVIFQTVAALTNLQYPLIKEVEELFGNDD